MQSCRGRGWTQSHGASVHQGQEEKPSLSASTSSSRQDPCSVAPLSGAPLSSRTLDSNCPCLNLHGFSSAAASWVLPLLSHVSITPLTNGCEDTVWPCLAWHLAHRMCPNPHVCPLWSAPFPCKLTSVAGSPGLRRESPGPLLTMQRPPRPSQEVRAQWVWGTVFFTSSLVTLTSQTSGKHFWADSGWDAELG